MAVKMTKKEQALLNDLDEFIHRWEALDKPAEIPPEIPLYRRQAVLWESVCDKIKQGMARGRVNPEKSTYKDVLIRCQL